MTAVPAVKGKMGNIEYFQCTMSSKDLVARTQSAREYFSEEDWDEMGPTGKMQRDVSDRYLKQIAPYLLRTKDRFFNSIVVLLDPNLCKFKSLDENVLNINGKTVKASPRVMLKEQIKELDKKNLTMKSGVECEYFLISEDGSKIADTRDTQSKPCYDQSALMRRYDLIKEICDCMIEMGWGPYQNDHEDANGQFEMNWDYSDCLVTADRHVFFKYMVKSLAEKHGLRATFMPKPFENLTGNGCHAHISLWNGKINKFLDNGDRLGLSKLAYNFLGGIMKLTQPLTAFFNPTINSYRRINAPPTKSGATWSPSSISYTGNNRTHMIRVPDKGRFELRLMDGAANPYLLQAGVIAAGLHGINNKIDPGEPLSCNMYTDYKNYPNLKKLPDIIEDALEQLENSREIREAFGDETIKSYLKLKRSEIDNFDKEETFDKKSPVTSWEKNSTLDC